MEIKLESTFLRSLGYATQSRLVVLATYSNVKGIRVQ